MYLDGIAAGSSLGLVGPSSDSFLVFRVLIFSGSRNGASEISETLSDKHSGISVFAGLRGNQRRRRGKYFGKKERPGKLSSSESKSWPSSSSVDRGLMRFGKSSAYLMIAVLLRIMLE